LLTTLLPETFDSLVRGGSRVTGQIRKKKPDSPVQTQFTGEGFTMGKFRNSCFYGASTFTDSSYVKIDSVVVTDQNVVLSLQGIIRTDTATGYDLRVKGVVDSFSLDEAVSGAFQFRGTISGTGQDPRFSVQAEGQQVTVMNHLIGNVSLASTGNSDNISMTLHSSDSISGVLEIKRPFSKKPEALLDLNIGTASINSLLKRNSGIPEIRTAMVEISGEGWIDAFNATVSAAVEVKDVRAFFNGTIEKQADCDAMRWTLSKRILSYRGIPVEFSAHGELYNDSLVIDSLTLLDGVNIHGSLYLASQPIGIEAECEYAVPVSKVLEFVPGAADMDVSGSVSGKARVSGTIDQPHIRSEFHVRECGFSTFNNLQADAILTSNSGTIRIYPMVIRKDSGVLATFDTITINDSAFIFSGEFDNIDVRTVLGASIPQNHDIDARLSGTVKSSSKGFPIMCSATVSSLRINKWKFGSATVNALLDHHGFHISSLRTQDELLHIDASGFIPWSIFENSQMETDTLVARIDARGDFLHYIGNSVDSPIKGSAMGKAKVAFWSVPGSIKFTEGVVDIPQGVLSLRPFVLSDINNFTLSMSIDSTEKVHTSLSGKVKRRSISIVSTHAIPEGFEPFTIGPFDFGIFQVKTPQRGIDIHLPGFMPVGDVGDIEFQGKKPFKYFTLSGPVERLRITGTWVLRSLEFTFPFLNTNEMSWEFDPFPYVTWDLDLRPGDRHMMYFWDLTGKRARILRFLEGYLDPTSIVQVRGRDLDSDFRLYGLIRSYRGTLYYGKMFDRNFNVGVEFEPQKLKNHRGYDNLPVIWGSAEARDDIKRVNRTKITCLVHDPQTNAVAQRGRLVDGKTLNISFQLSSEFDGVPGDGEREFFNQAGLSFSTLGGAGELVSDFGEQYFHRYLLERLEKRLAKRVGLDVINIESSITSNYFNKLYGRQFERLVNHDDYLAFANLGITVGRYFFRDYLFFKARGELIPIDTTLLRPEYSIGLEVQPNRYLLMGFDYGVHQGETDFEHDPRVALQLTLPITRLRTLLKF
jgi:hypothetical protein